MAGWLVVRRNKGAAGIDETTVAMVEEYGVTRLMDKVGDELRDGRHRPLAARRVFIPKPGSSKWRPLSIPRVRDRVVQAVVKIVLEPTPPQPGVRVVRRSLRLAGPPRSDRPPWDRGCGQTLPGLANEIEFRR